VRVRVALIEEPQGAETETERSPVARGDRIGESERSQVGKRPGQSLEATNVGERGSGLTIGIQSLPAPAATTPGRRAGAPDRVDEWMSRSAWTPRRQARSVRT